MLTNEPEQNIGVHSGIIVILFFCRHLNTSYNEKEDLNMIIKVLTDESKLVLQDGTVLEGAEKVSVAIFNICEVYRQAYNKAYVAELSKYAVRGAVVGVVIIAGYYAVKKYQTYLSQE